MISEYILYKNLMQEDTLAIVQYCQSLGRNIQPTMIVERNFPPSVQKLPAIATRSGLYHGTDDCVRFYEKVVGIEDLLEKSTSWKKNHPNYHCKS